MGNKPTNNGKDQRSFEVMSVTPSPYENFKMPSSHESPPELETKKLRLECILAAVTTGVRDSDHVVATAQKFWDFVQDTE